jgi:hypothetical protein
MPRSVSAPDVPAPFYPTTPQTTFEESGEHPLAETNHSCFVLRNSYENTTRNTEDKLR